MYKYLAEIKDVEEKRFVKMFLEFQERADHQYRSCFSDFYNVTWMESVIEKYRSIIGHGTFQFFGGFEGAERQILVVSPYELSEADYPICALIVRVKTGIGKKLTHRDFLGALLGLGIKRETIGDLLINEFGAYMIVNRSIASYIETNLTGIGRYKNIEIEEIAFNELKLESPKLKEVSMTVSSLRLDVIVSGAFGLSRSITSKLIQAEKIKCNGMSQSATYLVHEGNVISVRGYGKFILKEVGGLTKKDRQHVIIEKYV